VDTERHGVLRGLVADRVRGVAGHRHRLPDAGHLAPRPPVGVRDVEGQFPGEHPVDLAGRVPVHHRWAAARRHPELDGEQIAAGFRAAGEHGDLVGPYAERLDVGRGFDR
jgi:hypothetical protein